MQVRRSLWISFAASNANTMAFFFISLVLARLLTPRQIGIFSLSVIAINVASIFRDLGSNPYLIRKKDLSGDDIASVLGITVTMSWVMAASLWFGRHAIARYFAEPAIVPVLEILTFNFLLVPFSAVMNAMLVRDLRAKEGAYVSGFSTVAFGVTVLLLAWFDFGERSPALANTALLLANIIGFWLVMPKGFRLRLRWVGWGEPLRFSGGVLLSNIANMANQTLPEALIGKHMGAHEVGIFSRANGLTGLFQQAVGPTMGFNALPVLSRAFHDGPDTFKKVVRQSAELLTGVSWPVYIWIGTFAGEIIRVLYGPNWNSAAELVPWMCLAAAARTPLSIIGPALQAIDRPLSGAIAVLPNLALRVLFLAAFVATELPHFVIWLTVADILALGAWGFVTRRYLGIGLLELMGGQVRSLILGAVCLALCLAVKLVSLALVLPAWVTVPLSGLLLIVVWPYTVIRLSHPFSAELRVLAGQIPLLARRL